MKSLNLFKASLSLTTISIISLGISHPATAVLIKFDWSTSDAGYHLAEFFESTPDKPLGGYGFFDYDPQTPRDNNVGDYPGALQFSLTSNQKTLFFEPRLYDGRDVERGLDIFFVGEQPNGSLLYNAVGRTPSGGFTPSGIRAEVSLDFEIFGANFECDQPPGGTNLFSLPPAICLAFNPTSNPEKLTTVSGSFLTYQTFAGACETCDNTSLTFSNLKLVPEPASTLSLLVLGALGAGSLLKRKQQQK